MTGEIEGGEQGESCMVTGIEEGLLMDGDIPDMDMPSYSADSS